MKTTTFKHFKIVQNNNLIQLRFRKIFRKLLPAITIIQLGVYKEVL